MFNYLSDKDNILIYNGLKEPMNIIKRHNFIILKQETNTLVTWILICKSLIYI